MRYPRFSSLFQSLRFKLNVAPPDHFTVNYTSSSSRFLDQSFLKKEGPTDAKVYEVMAARAFDELSMKLRGVFFKEGSDAFDNAPRKPKRAVDTDEEPDEPLPF